MQLKNFPLYRTKRLLSAVFVLMLGGSHVVIAQQSGQHSHMTRAEQLVELSLACPLSRHIDKLPGEEDNTFETYKNEGDAAVLRIRVTGTLSGNKPNEYSIEWDEIYTVNYSDIKTMHSDESDYFPTEIIIACRDAERHCVQDEIIRHVHCTRGVTSSLCEDVGLRGRSSGQKFGVKFCDTATAENFFKAVNILVKLNRKHEANSPSWHMQNGLADFAGHDVGLDGNQPPICSIGPAPDPRRCDSRGDTPLVAICFTGQHPNTNYGRIQPCADKRPPEWCTYKNGVDIQHPENVGSPAQWYVCK